VTARTLAVRPRTKLSWLKSEPDVRNLADSGLRSDTSCLLKGEAELSPLSKMPALPLTLATHRGRAASEIHARRSQWRSRTAGLSPLAL
jgi:hypothetical protein